MRTAVPITILLALAALQLATPPGAGAQGIPGIEPNSCLAGKNRCVSKKISGLMKCRELCQKKPDKKCGQAQIDCEQKVMDKFDGGESPERGCFEKLESKEKPEKPESVCITTDDTEAFEAEVGDMVADLIARLEDDDREYCGDYEINTPSEQCDGPDLGGASCTDFGYAGGILTCDVAVPCNFDFSACTHPSPQVIDCPAACADALIAFPQHDFATHFLYEWTCSSTDVLFSWSAADFAHADGIEIRADRCAVTIESTVLADLLLTSEEAQACRTLASIAVQLTDVGFACDVSTP